MGCGAAMKVYIIEVSFNGDTTEFRKNGDTQVSEVLKDTANHFGI